MGIEDEKRRELLRRLPPIDNGEAPQRETFATYDEAEAFSSGLSWGDEPRYAVVGIERGMSGWLVMFRHVDG